MQKLTTIEVFFLKLPILYLMNMKISKKVSGGGENSKYISTYLFSLYIHKYLRLTYLVCKDLYPLEKKIAIKKAIDSSLPPTAFFWIVRALFSKNGIILLGNVSIIRGFGELSM